MTERNDGLIDGTKSRSRWDFGEFKDFILQLHNRFLLQGFTRRRKIVGKVPVKYDPLKFGQGKHEYSFTYNWRWSFPPGCWPTSMLPLQVTLTSRTLSVKEIPLMVKFTKMKDRQFPKKKKLWLCHGTYKLFVVVALNTWILRVFQGVNETEHQALQEGEGGEGERKREVKGKMSLP